MTIKNSVYIATSLDGFIAREDGAIDWLMEANKTVPPGEDCGYADFMKSVDVLVMGRNTYEQVATFDPWPYQGKRVVVLSSSSIVFPERLGRGVEARWTRRRMNLASFKRPTARVLAHDPPNHAARSV